MTQPSPQDDLPPGPWTMRQFEYAWEIRAVDGGLICFVQSEPLARAITEIPEMRETIKTQHEAIFALNKELDRLRRLVECKDCMEYAQSVVTAERTENDRLRAENVDLRKQIIGKDTEIQDLENEANSLRAEKAELLIALESFSKTDDAEFDRVRDERAELIAERDAIEAATIERCAHLCDSFEEPHMARLIRKLAKTADETEGK